MEMAESWEVDISDGREDQVAWGSPERGEDGIIVYAGGVGEDRKGNGKAFEVSATDEEVAEVAAVHLEGEPVVGGGGE